MSEQEKAFPRAHDVYQRGMDLRDFFAATALEGLLVREEYSTRNKTVEVARLAYRIADAMIEAKRQ